MSTPISAISSRAAMIPTPGISSSWATSVRERGDRPPRCAPSSAATSASRVSMWPSMRCEQKRVMVGEEPGQRLDQVVVLAPQHALGHLREHPRVALPLDQGLHHCAPGLAEDVAGHHRQLDPGVLQQLLHPLLLPRDLPDTDYADTGSDPATPESVWAAPGSASTRRPPPIHQGGRPRGARGCKQTRAHVQSKRQCRAPKTLPDQTHGRAHGTRVTRPDKSDHRPDFHPGQGRGASRSVNSRVLAPSPVHETRVARYSNRVARRPCPGSVTACGDPGSRR